MQNLGFRIHVPVYVTLASINVLPAIHNQAPRIQPLLGSQVYCLGTVFALSAREEVSNVG